MKLLILSTGLFAFRSQPVVVLIEYVFRMKVAIYFSVTKELGIYGIFVIHCLAWSVEIYLRLY